MSADKAEDIACKWKYARRSDSWLAWMLRCLGCLAAWDASLFRRYIVLSSVRWRLLLALPKRRQKSPEMGISIFHTHTAQTTSLSFYPPSRSHSRQCTAKRCRRNCSTTEAQKGRELLHKWGNKPGPCRRRHAVWQCESRQTKAAPKRVWGALSRAEQGEVGPLGRRIVFARMISQSVC